MARLEHEQRNIWVTCDCGKRLRASARLLGRRAKCPRCDAQFVVMPSFDEASELLDSTHPPERGKMFVETPQKKRLLPFAFLVFLVGLSGRVTAANPPGYNSVHNLPGDRVLVLPYFPAAPNVVMYEIPNQPSARQLQRNALRKQHAAAANAAKSKQRETGAAQQLAEPPNEVPVGATEEEQLRHAVHAMAAKQPRRIGPKARALVYREAKACSLTVEEYVNLYLETELQRHEE